MGRSIATIDSPEFINVTPYNPQISKCEIKVLYVGENRNHSYISKTVAAEMANSLPGCPIVGYFKTEKDDFTDHGQRITMDGDGVKFETLTKPYGFVAPNAEVWFKKFDDSDAFGNIITREYLMTNGYLWTGQYEEAQRVIEHGNNQSMELDENSLNGKWATNNNTGVEFFIINDAIFSKLAILGEDVEPCFEGASITAPDVSSSFSLDGDFKKTLFSMMHDLQDALESSEGGLNNYMRTKQQLLDDGVIPSMMSPEEKKLFTPEEMAKMVADEKAAKKTAAKASLDEGLKFSELNAEDAELFTEEEVNEFALAEEAVDAAAVEEARVAAEFAAVTPDKGEARNAFMSRCMKSGNSMGVCAASWKKAPGVAPTQAELENEETLLEPTLEDKFALLETTFADLNTRFTALEAEAVTLREFKTVTEDAQKDALIKSFYMLSDADKADVIDNKSNYSLGDIESKLAVICVRNRVSFDQGDTNDEDGAPIITFNLEGTDGGEVPEFIQALRKVQIKD